MRQGRRGYEVTWCWRSTVLATELFAPPETVWVGTHPGARFALPDELVGEPFALLVPDEAGGMRLQAPRGARTETSGGASVVSMGDFTFVVRETEMPDGAAPRNDPDWRAWRYVALSFLLHGVVIGLFQLMPPNAMALSRDVDGGSIRYIRYRLDAVQRDRAAERSWLEKRAGASPSGQAQPAPSAPTETLPRGAGAPEARRGGGAGTPRPLDARAVRQLGTLRALAAAVRGTDIGHGPYTGAGLGPGALVEGPLPSLFGGLGIAAPRGSCTGAGCLAGTIAVGPLATRPGRGTWAGAADVRLGPRRPMAGSTPIIRPGKTETSGRLGAEQVRRVVHRNLSQVRFCYERALARRPDLQGRVAVKFIVSPSGTVQTALVAQSDLGAPEVDACVTAAVRRWTFPASQGLTVVTYPFVLEQTQ